MKLIREMMQITRIQTKINLQRLLTLDSKIKTASNIYKIMLKLR